MKLMQRNRKRVIWILAVTMLVVSCAPGYGLEVKAADTLKEGDYSYAVNSDGKSVTIKGRGNANQNKRMNEKTEFFAERL